MLEYFGLDPQTLRLMKHLLIERARQGMAILLSTHQLPIVEDLAHRHGPVGRVQGKEGLSAV